MDWLTAASTPPRHQAEQQTLPPETYPEQIWYAYSGERDPTHSVWIWLHGWGQSHQAFLTLLQQLEPDKDHLIIDFPGFGHSPMPSITWGTEEYAHQLNKLIKRVIPPHKKIVLIGHSFGCRVAIQYHYFYPENLQGLIFIGGAGLQKRRSVFQRIQRSLIKATLQIAKQFDHLFPTHFADKVRQRFGSSDYLQAGFLRPILSRVVSEDLSERAKSIRLPVLLLYGELDNEAPPEFGTRYNALISNSELHILPNIDHYSILTHAKYNLKRLISDWISKAITKTLAS
jgi:pimeloyl-ACP methyl ester carboxylesterase